MLYSVTHTTKYRYADSVSLCHNLVHLKPRVAPRQTCHQSHLLVQPEPRGVQHYHDYFGNPIALFTIQEPHRNLTITAKHRLEVAPREPMRLEDSLSWEAARETLTSERMPALLDALAFTFASKYVPRDAGLAAYAAPSFTPGRPLLEAAMDLTARIYKEFRYDAKATTLSTPLGEVLERRRGVCQDFAHLAIGCLRSLGLPARYVSGYLQTRVPAGRERLVGADASHAWFAVYCPGVGWVDFDPTNNVMPSEQHLTIAWGRDYEDISPIKGVILGGGSHTMSIAVDVAEAQAPP
jgi:transglutaminase-like putative cysteine protease